MPVFSPVSFICLKVERAERDCELRKRPECDFAFPGLLSIMASVIISTGSLCSCVVMCRHRELWESWVISTDEKQMAVEVQ